MFAIGESRLAGWVQGSAETVVTTSPGPPGTVWVGLDVMVCGLGVRNGWGLLIYPERHGENYNQLLCDAHIEAIKPFILFNVTNSALRWNNDHQPHPEAW
jgi:hypothetical protein